MPNDSKDPEISVETRPIESDQEKKAPLNKAQLNIVKKGLVLLYFHLEYFGNHATSSLSRTFDVVLQLQDLLHYDKDSYYA